MLGPVVNCPHSIRFTGERSTATRTSPRCAHSSPALPRDGPPVVLVTHQFTITAFTGQGTASGGGTVFELNGSGTPRALGAIRAD